MKKQNPKKWITLLHLAFAILAWLATPSARAWTYQDGDVLLIFRESGSDDVEFDIGNISQFLNHANGYTTKVTGWDPNLVVNTFGQVSGASVILASTTSASSWLTSSSDVTSVSDVTPSAWHSQLYSLIDAIGVRPTNYNETTAATNAYVIQELGDTSADQSSLASYDYVVSGGGVNEAYISQFGGNVPFAVEGVAPGTLGFWQIQPNSTIPKPSAAYVGTFTIDQSGNLTFVAGPLQPTGQAPQILVLNGTNVIDNGQSIPVDFGTLVQNQPGVTLTFTVTNSGQQTLDLTNITVPVGFTLDTNYPSTIAAGSSGEFSVQLATTNVGVFSGDIDIINNDPTVVNSTFSFPVTGTVAAASSQIQVLNGTNVISNGQTSAVNFGIVSQNQTGVSVNFTVLNTGAQTLDLTNIMLPQGYTLVASFPASIASGSSGTFSVQLNTAAIGLFAGNIIITNNDPANNPFFFPITGLVSDKIISLSGNLAFGVVPLGSSANRTLTINNAGTATLTVSNIIYPSGFSGNWPGGQITVGNAQQVTVTFSPTSATNYSGAWVVNSDANSGANTLPLTAFGANTNLLLTILTNGEGTVTPNDARIIKQGAKVSLKAVAGKMDIFSNWTGSVNSTNNPLTFTMEKSTIVQANFIPNPFLPFVGTYNGLFTATNGIISETNAGMLKGLTVTSKGTYSGSLLIDGLTKSISGAFDLAGQASKTISLGSKLGEVEVVLTLTSNDPAPQVTGTVSGNGWISTNLLADRATNAPVQPHYTVLIEPDTNSDASPIGDGYALITGVAGTPKIPATVNITGALADGTALSQSAPVSLDGYVPIFVNLYTSKGLVTGWINLTNSSGAALAWVHPVRPGLVPSAFTSTCPVLLSPWTIHPAADALPANLMVVETTDNTPVQTNDFTIKYINAVLDFGKETGPETALSGSVGAKTGLLTVAIGSGAAKTVGHGVVLLNGTNGGGYFLTKTNAGAVVLEP